MAEREHQTLLRSALAHEAEAQRLLLAAEDERAAEAFAEVAQLYRESWEAAPERAFGRLVGMLKASVLANSAAQAAAFAHQELGDVCDSPSSAYAVALAALIGGDDELATKAAAAMAEGGDAFARTSEAITSLAASDGAGYRRALEAIVEDFEARDAHLTGVAIADTAVVLERLAERRGLEARISSPVMGTG